MKIKIQNRNTIVFVVCFAFIIAGMLSSDVLHPIANSILGVVTGEVNLENAKNTIESAVTDSLNYHGDMVSLNGWRENILGTRIIQKEDDFVVKADSGSLIGVVDKADVTEVSYIVNAISDLKNVAENNGAKFLYCAAPAKEVFEKAPANAENYSQYNYEMFLSLLRKSEIPYLDLSKELIDSNMSVSEMFYYTDHHWRTYAGFVATNAICKELNTRYRFEYNKQYTDIGNYTIENYSDWFLGSKGKKVGMFFTNHGADDFELIIPKFDTDMIEERPATNYVREGTFEETVLHTDKLEKNYYHGNTYAVYGGGDFELQLVKNNLNPTGKKVVIVRDSFASVVVPFFALQTSELHVCDVRDFDFYKGEKLNMKDYIEEIEPDYVLVLYNGISEIDEEIKAKYNFF